MGLGPNRPEGLARVTRAGGPTSVTGLGRAFPIRIGRKIWTVLEDRCGPRGYVDGQQIVIRASLSSREKNITLLHEMLHLLGVEDEAWAEELARKLYRALAWSGLYRDPFGPET